VSLDVYMIVVAGFSRQCALNIPSDSRVPGRFNPTGLLAGAALQALAPLRVGG